MPVEVATASRQGRDWLSLPVYPALIVVAFLSSEFLEIWPAPATFVRPLLALLLVVVGFQLVLWRMLGHGPAAYLAALAFLLAFDLPVAVVLYAAGLAAIAWGSLRARRLAGVDWPAFARVVNLIVAISIGLGAINVVTAAASLPGASAAPSTTRSSLPSDPDIYLVLLDAYPRADIVSTVLGKDTSAFLQGMESAGFDVADRSHTNYNRTILTVTSIVSGQHVDDLVAAPPVGAQAQERLFTSLIHGGNAFDTARSFGYRILAIPSQLVRYAPIQADEVLDSGHLSQFEYLLPRDGAIQQLGGDALTSFLREQHRQRVFASLATLAGLADLQEPYARMVFAHVMVPHNPIAFRSDGTPASAADCYWDKCILEDPLSPAIKDALGEQIEFTNREVLALAERIIARSVRPTVIVFFGDHGFRHWASDGPETFRNLFVSRTPDHPGLFGDEPAPINLVPRILNAYLGTSLPLAREDVWITVGTANGYFPMTRWDAEPGS